jgi:hypothetical protein
LQARAAAPNTRASSCTTGGPPSRRATHQLLHAGHGARRHVRRVLFAQPLQQLARGALPVVDEPHGAGQGLSVLGLTRRRGPGGLRGLAGARRTQQLARLFQPRLPRRVGAGAAVICGRKLLRLRSAPLVAPTTPAAPHCSRCCPLPPLLPTAALRADVSCWPSSGGAVPRALPEARSPAEARRARQPQPHRRALPRRRCTSAAPLQLRKRRRRRRRRRAGAQHPSARGLYVRGITMWFVWPLIGADEAKTE